MTSSDPHLFHLEPSPAAPPSSSDGCATIGKIEKERSDEQLKILRKKDFS